MITPTVDRRGLLARIARVLEKANGNVVSARINALGERAEDVFLIDGNRLHDEQALLKGETMLYEQLRVQPLGCRMSRARDA